MLRAGANFTLLLHHASVEQIFLTSKREANLFPSGNKVKKGSTMPNKTVLRFSAALCSIALAKAIAPFDATSARAVGLVEGVAAGSFTETTFARNHSPLALGGALHAASIAVMNRGRALADDAAPSVIEVSGVRLGMNYDEVLDALDQAGFPQTAQPFSGGSGMLVRHVTPENFDDLRFVSTLFGL